MKAKSRAVMPLAIALAIGTAPWVLAPAWGGDRITDPTLPQRGLRQLAPQKVYERSPFSLTLSVDPSTGSNQTVRLSALRKGEFPPVNLTCKWEAISTVRGDRQAADNDAVCQTRQFTLAPGTYRFRLSYRHQKADGSWAEGSSEVATYVVAPGFRLEIPSLQLDPPQPVAGRDLTIRMLVKNTGAGAAPAFPYRFSTNRQDSINGATGTVPGLAPGGSVALSASLRPSAPGPLSVTAAVDPENTLNAPPAARVASTRTSLVTVGGFQQALQTPPIPVIVLGDLIEDPVRFTQVFTICNVVDETYSEDTNYDIRVDFGVSGGTTGRASEHTGYAREGGRLKPPCPGNLASRPALPGAAAGPRPARLLDCAPVTRRLSVKATRYFRGRSGSMETPWVEATYGVHPLGCVQMEPGPSAALHPAPTGGGPIAIVTPPAGSPPGSFDQDVGNFHVKLGNGNASISGNTATLSGTVAVWPKAAPSLKMTVRNAGVAATKTGSAPGIAGAGTQVGRVAGGAPGRLVCPRGASGTFKTAGGYQITVDPTCSKATVRPPGSSKETAISAQRSPGTSGLASERTFVLPDGTRITLVATGQEQGRAGTALPENWVSVRGSGTLELAAGPVTLTIAGGSFESRPDGTVGLSGGDVSVRGCAHQVGQGSALGSAGVQLSGTLRCGPVALASSTLRLGPGGIAGSGRLQAAGHTFDMTYAATGQTLTASGGWTATSRGWQTVPGVDPAEYQVTNPRVQVGLNGPTLTATLAVDKVQVRTKARNPNGDPVAQAETTPGALTINASGDVRLPLPSLPQPPDANKGVRDTCKAAANQIPDPLPPPPPGAPRGPTRSEALAACDAANPFPQGVPSLPTSIPVNLTAVTS